MIGTSLTVTPSTDEAAEAVPTVKESEAFTT